MADCRPAVIVLVLLSALAAVAATTSAARWLDCGSGASFSGAALLWTGLVVTPLHALGWLDRLAPAPLAAASAALSGGLLALALGRAPVARLAAARALATGWGHDALARVRDGVRRRHPVALAIPLVAVVLAYTAWLTYLAPSSSWDGMWYHDTIAGLAIQQRGFATVEVPPALEFVNGYPKTSELLGVWLVLFWDDRLLELPTTLYAPLLVVATAAWGRRVAVPRLDAAAWAVVLLLVPGAVLELRSTYVDLPFAAVALATALFALPRLGDGPAPRPAPPAEVLVAALGLGLVAGMKGTGLVVAPALGLALALRVVGLVRRRPLVGLATAVAVAALVAGLAAPPYVRNALLHGNPTWPVTLDLPALGIDWKGVWAVEMDKPFREALDDVLSVPPRGQQFHDVRLASYGLALPWVLAPLALVGLARAAGAAVAGRSRPGRRGAARTLLLLAALLLPTLALSPAWYIARFNLHALAALVLAAAVGLDALRRITPRLPDVVLGLLLVTLTAQLAWSRPGWEVPFARAVELAGQTPAARAAAKLSPVMGDEATLRALERELGPGDLVLFTRDFGFPSVLWNRRFDNAIAFEPARGARLVREAEARGAAWVVVRDGSVDARALDRADGWARVGATSDVNVAFRRSNAE